jgi:carbon monoxide dehydrogenase subunit G
MRLEQSFEVPVPVAQAWAVLLDVERIAPCMPGATLTGFDGDSFTGSVRVKLGPVSLAYKGTGRFTERDESARRVSIVAQGQDSRGAGGAQARVTAVLHNANNGASTLVKVVADVDIAGKAAQFGRGLIADVSSKLVKQFADCLAETIAAEPVPAAAAAVAAPVVAAAPVVDAVAPPAPPPLAPVFTEPTPPVVAEPAPVSPVVPEPVAVTPPVFAEPAAPSFAEPAAVPDAPAPAPAPASVEPAPAPAYTPPPATNTNPPEYHPLALQEPAEGASTEVPAAPASAGFPEPEAAPKSAAEYAYTPEPAPAPAATTPAPVKPAPKEAEPIDLLAVSGARGMLRRAAPVLVIVGLALVGVIVWLIVA